FLQEFSFFLVLEERQEFFQRPPAISHQTYFHRKPQPDSLGIEIDLNSAGLVRLGQELDIRKGRAYHKQSVTVLDGLLRRFSSQQTYSSCGIGAIVRNTSFAEQCFNNGRRKLLGGLFQSIG